MWVSSTDANAINGRVEVPVDKAGPQAGAEGRVGETAKVECALAAVLADVLGVAEVPVDGHFFDDLGADSMVMARFCARVRKRADLPSVSMKDIYRRPTVRDLAAATPAELTARAAEPEAAHRPPLPPVPARRRRTAVPAVRARCSSDLRRVSYLVALGSTVGYRWMVRRPGLLDLYLRAVLVGGGAFRRRLRLLPIVAKWVLDRALEAAADPSVEPGLPPVLGGQDAGAGEPAGPVRPARRCYVLYLRALGARIGRGVAIFSHSVPVCTDLLTIGAGTVIRKDALISGYRAHAG